MELSHLKDVDNILIKTTVDFKSYWLSSTALLFEDFLFIESTTEKLQQRIEYLLFMPKFYKELPKPLLCICVHIYQYQISHFSHSFQLVMYKCMKYFRVFSVQEGRIIITQ